MPPSLKLCPRLPFKLRVARLTAGRQPVLQDRERKQAEPQLGSRLPEPCLWLSAVFSAMPHGYDLNQMQHCCFK